MRSIVLKQGPVVSHVSSSSWYLVIKEQQLLFGEGFRSRCQHDVEIATTNYHRITLNRDRYCSCRVVDILFFFSVRR